MDSKSNMFFVSEKVSKVRWVPEQFKEAESFLTGSWDMRTNYVRIWRLRKNQFSDELNDYVHSCSDKIAFHGDISGLEFLSDDKVVAACSDGHISIIKINRAVEEDTLKEESRSTLLHKFKADDRAAPCTGISIYGTDVATVGEDGILNIVNVGNALTIHHTIEADSCSLTAVAYINPQEILAGNRMGVIRMFDIRASGNEKSATTLVTCCQDTNRANSASCLTNHPTQPYVVIAGTEEGTITVWDLRSPNIPVSFLSSHTSAITEINFHATDPTKLFTTAECGEMWLWSQNTGMSTGMDETNNINPWLTGELAKNRITVTSLVTNLRKPLNSFSAHRSRIICGGDTEAVYYMDNVI